MIGVKSECCEGYLVQCLTSTESLTYQKSLDSENLLQVETPPPRSIPEIVTKLEDSGQRLYAPCNGKVPELELRISSVPGGEYHLPGYGESYDSCNRVKFLIYCPSCGDEPVEAHDYCDRKECPVCSSHWATRRAKVATEKIESAHRQMGGNGHRRPRHMSVSLPASTWDLPYNDVLTIARELITKVTVGFCGGTYVGHPWRFEDSQGESLEWKHCDLNRKAVEPIYEGYAVYRPHVHFIMFGWIPPSEEIYEKTGVVIHMIDVLPTEADVFWCIRYQLTHCGVDQEHHAIRWFGGLSYNNFMKVSESTETVYPRCPVCDGELWTYSVDGDFIGRYSLMITRYHYRFKPRQQLLEKPVKPIYQGIVGDSRHKGRSPGEEIMSELFQRRRALEGKH